MPNVRFFIGAILAIGLASCASTRVSDAVVTADTDNALLVLKLENFSKLFSLHLAEFDETEQKILGGALTSRNSFTLQKSLPSASGERFLFADVPSGKYVLSAYMEQERWGNCFQASTLSFDAKPGSVTLLGSFDQQPQTARLTLNALIGADTYSRSRRDITFYFDDIDPPEISTPDQAFIEDVEMMISDSFSGVDAPTIVAEFSQAKFGIGRNLYGTQRVCGGYYRGEAGASN